MTSRPPSTAGTSEPPACSKGMKSLSTPLSGAQLRITVTNLAIGFLAEPAIAALIGPALVDRGLGTVAARSVSVTIALVLATAIHP